MAVGLSTRVCWVAPGKDSGLTTRLGLSLAEHLSLLLSEPWLCLGALRGGFLHSPLDTVSPGGLGLDMKQSPSSVGAGPLRNRTA